MAEPTVQELQRQLEELNRKLKEAGGLGIDLQEAFRNAGNDTAKLNTYLNQLNKQYSDLVDNADYIYRTFQDISAELKNQNLLLKIGKSSFKEFTNIAQDLNYYQKGTNELTDKQFKKIKNNLALEKQELEFVVAKLKASERSREIEAQALASLSERTPKQEARLKELQKENELLINASEALKSGIPVLEKELNLTKQIADTREDLGGMSQAAGKLVSEYGGSLAKFLNIKEATEAVEEFNKKLIQGALNNKEVQNKLLDIEKEKKQIEEDRLNNLITEGEYLRKIQEQEDKAYQIKQQAIAGTNTLGNKFKSLGVFTKELGIGFKKALLDPVTIITFFIGKALEANKQAVELGKSLAYGNDRAEDFRENIADIASNSNNINVTAANLVEAFNDLAQATGFVYEYTADQLETQIVLTKQVGLQADEAAQIQRLGVLNGKTSEETYKSFVRGLTAARNQLRVGINFKATLAEALKVSGQLAANLGYNPERIAKAIVQAKALGFTLDQVAKAGEQLLNFESSIENELKAELLTGKQLNLERARAAALAGDQITLAEELAKNVGTSADFAKMNVLQQKSLAESVGMTTDELAESLRKREEAIASGKSLAQIQEEEAKEALERQTIQDKFNQSILKLQDLIGNLVAGPLAMFIDGLSTVLNIVNYITKPIQWMADLSKYIGETISGWADALGPFGILLKGIAGIAILLAGYGAYAALSWIPVVGPVLGAVAAAAVIGKGFSALNSQKADDMVSEGGYGKRTLLAPEGAIKLNDKDTVIAGTNLGGGDGKGVSPSIDLTPMIAAINEVKAAVNNLVNRPVVVNMDGKKVGSGLVQGSYKMA